LTTVQSAKRRGERPKIGERLERNAFVVEVLREGISCKDALRCARGARSE
jgi:hypothetical protein